MKHFVDIDETLHAKDILKSKLNLGVNYQET